MVLLLCLCLAAVWCAAAAGQETGNATQFCIIHWAGPSCRVVPSGRCSHTSHPCGEGVTGWLEGPPETQHCTVCLPNPICRHIDYDVAGVPLSEEELQHRDTLVQEPCWAVTVPLHNETDSQDRVVTWGRFDLRTPRCRAVRVEVSQKESQDNPDLVASLLRKEKRTCYVRRNCTAAAFSVLGKSANPDSDDDQTDSATALISAFSGIAFYSLGALAVHRYKEGKVKARAHTEDSPKSEPPAATLPAGPELPETSGRWGMSNASITDSLDSIDTRCPICMSTMSEPHHCKQGHHMCFACWVQCLSGGIGGGRSVCPLDNVTPVAMGDLRRSDALCRYLERSGADFASSRRGSVRSGAVPRTHEPASPYMPPRRLRALPPPPPPFPPVTVPVRPLLTPILPATPAHPRPTHPPHRNPRGAHEYLV